MSTDDEGLAAFCRDEWPRLVGSMSLYLGQREAAEDIAQETLVRVCMHWKTVRSARSPSAWAHRVAFNLAKSSLRREATWRRNRGRFQVGTDLSGPSKTDALAIRDALLQLPATQRQVLVLRYYADLSVRDVADLMRCPENTVKTHTRRALDVLRSGGLVDDEPTADPITEDVT